MSGWTLNGVGEFVVGPVIRVERIPLPAAILVEPTVFDERFDFLFTEIFVVLLTSIPGIGCSALGELAKFIPVSL